MKLRHALLASGLLALSFGSALAQTYPPEPPPGYLQGPPPGDWEHHEWWRRMSERERHEFYAEHRREAWRCDHGDRGACHWLHEHEG